MSHHVSQQWLISDLILPTGFLEPSLISDSREVPYLSPAPHSSGWQSFSFLCSSSRSLTSQNSTQMTTTLLTKAIVWVKCKYSCTMANLPYLLSLKVARAADLLWSWKEKVIHVLLKHPFGQPLCFLQVWSDLTLWAVPLTWAVNCPHYIQEHLTSLYLSPFPMVHVF